MKTIISMAILFITFNASADLADVKDWIESNHFKTEVSSEITPEIKKSLKKDLNNREIVFLGEADHYYHEKYVYRLAFIKELLKLGFYSIYEEMGTASARRVNLFLSTGDETYLKQVGLFGYKYGETLRFRDNAHVKEHVGFMKELRKLKKIYPKLEYSGFDLDMRPGTAYLDYDKFRQQDDVIEFARSNADFAQSLELFEKSKTSKVAELYLEVGFKAANKVIVEGSKKIHNYSYYLYFYENLKNSIAFDKKLKEKPFNWKIFDWREEKMFKIMQYKFSKDPVGKKYIFLGHNGHLIKTDSKNINRDRYTTWNTIGAWITKRRPEKVYAIWNFIGRGEHRGHGCPGGKTCSFELFPETLEEMLFDISPTKNLYFKNSAVIKENEHLLQTVVNGIEPTFGKYGDSADAFYFIPVVSDLKD